MNPLESKRDEGATIHDVAIGGALRLEAELRALEQRRREKGYIKPESELSVDVSKILEIEASYVHSETTQDTLGLSPTGIAKFTEITVFPQDKPKVVQNTNLDTKNVIKPIEQLTLDSLLVNPRWDKTKRWTQKRRVRRSI